MNYLAWTQLYWWPTWPGPSYTGGLPGLDSYTGDLFGLDPAILAAYLDLTQLYGGTYLAWTQPPQARSKKLVQGSAPLLENDSTLHTPEVSQGGGGRGLEYKPVSSVAGALSTCGNSQLNSTQPKLFHSFG